MFVHNVVDDKHYSNLKLSENKQSCTSIVAVTNPDPFVVVATWAALVASTAQFEAVTGSRGRRKDKEGLSVWGAKMNLGFNLWIEQHRIFFIIKKPMLT